MRLDTRPSLLRSSTRMVRLAALPAGALLLAGEGVVRRRLLGQDATAVRHDLRRRGATRARRTLGRLHGGAQKAGQLLSTVDALLPADPDASWSAALTALQAEAPGVPFPAVEPQLAELGADWRRLLPRLDPAPVAAASLGQVHRGRWHDGRDVAVKLQYPGVAEALAADLAALSVASRTAALVARGLTLPPLLAEMRTRLTEELDYRTEGERQRRFAAAYADDPEVAVPRVVTATAHVLVQEWQDGTPLVAVARDGSAEERDALGAAYQRFLLSGPERAGLLHTDPHPGNFRRTPDGRLGVVDFGSALELPDGMPPTFGRLIRLLLRGDPAAVEAGLREEGFVRPGVHVDAAKLLSYLAPFTEPARHETFSYDPEWLRGQFGRVDDPRDPDFAVALRLDVPAEHLFTHRVWLGVVGVLCRLRATVPVAPELRRWLPGFAE